MNSRTVSVAAALLVVLSASAQADPITSTEAVTNWSRQDSPIVDSNTDVWTDNSPFIDYIFNSGGSLISDFTQDTDFTFSADITNLDTDNDRYGIVFGWQDSQNHYRVSWERGGLSDNGFRGLNFLREVNNTVTNLFTTNINWQLGEVYDVTAGRSGSSIFFNIVRESDSAIIASQSVVDTTFTTGNVGLFTRSQRTRFGDLDFSVIPEPSTLTLLGIAGVLGAGYRFRRRLSR